MWHPMETMAKTSLSHFRAFWFFNTFFFMSASANVHWWLMNVCEFRCTRLARMCFNVNLKLGLQMAVILPLKYKWTLNSGIYSEKSRILTSDFIIISASSSNTGIVWELTDRTCTSYVLYCHFYRCLQMIPVIQEHVK